MFYYSSLQVSEQELVFFLNSCIFCELKKKKEKEETSPRVARPGTYTEH